MRESAPSVVSPEAPPITAAVRPAPILLHKSDRVTLWQGDARDVLPAVPKETAGLILTDPPYGKEWRSNTRSEQFEQLLGDGADEREDVADVIEQCVRIVGQNRHLYVFGPDDVLEGQKVSEVVQLIWDKGVLGSGDVTASWGPAHEQINFCTSLYRHAGKAGKSTVPARLRKGSVLRFTRPTGRKVRHPSEKPVPLLQELIESSSRRGDLIVDAFAGIGSTGVAAVLSGRRALLIEKDPRWAEDARERVLRAEQIADEMVTA